MSVGRYYPLEVRVRRPYRIERRGETVEAVPSADDVPTGIRVERAGRVLAISFLYPRGLAESTKSFDQGSFSVELGVHSGRLFKIKVDASPLAGRSKPEREVLRLLRDEILSLRNLDHRIGPTVNYELAAQGLAPDGIDAPPAWLIDAMRAQSSRPSAGN